MKSSNWMQVETMDRRGLSYSPRCTTARVDRRIVGMAVMDHAAASQNIEQQIQSVAYHSVSARTIRCHLQNSGMSTRHPLLCLPLAGNHKRLHLPPMNSEHGQRNGTTLCLLTNSGFCLQHHDTLSYALPDTLNNQRYMSDVIEPVVFPCIQRLPSAIFQQDNA
ncbi:transposable element Tcb1 transposase [Trichonephila clavipes]|nr:transposable element Tcb1 transposase [Trichonephila clavipes]